MSAIPQKVDLVKWRQPGQAFNRSFNRAVIHVNDYNKTGFKERRKRWMFFLTELKNTLSSKQNFYNFLKSLNAVWQHDT